MAGGLTKYRHLGRKSSARNALLRGLVTSLVEHEHIQTTYAKAKEAQRLAEKLITLAKRDNEPCRRSAQGILYLPHLHLPKLFGPLKERYMDREGGYTRVVRTEPMNTYDQAESAILEFVDGARDSRFMLTAKAVARDRMLGVEHRDLTRENMEKVTKHRGEAEFEAMVKRYMVKDIHRNRDKTRERAPKGDVVMNDVE
ncbi:hypothetical protein LMH87_010454 [Akanthomyces muscarius]|uniref:50S ribosomal protein L17 n=1 Tax=Akanthomyces muscarius TaxID=2231603 RepID=A0A9W8QE87_AKAMU|nr:hypothetical protein LMH87_010454 [Akanthomyces muscarius]KAJ4153990.1 hypothetical protein LMH87_010454 [Akanthomyces muscarius]